MDSCRLRRVLAKRGELLDKLPSDGEMVSLKASSVAVEKLGATKGHVMLDSRYAPLFHVLRVHIGVQDVVKHYNVSLLVLRANCKTESI